MPLATLRFTEPVEVPLHSGFREIADSVGATNMVTALVTAAVQPLPLVTVAFTLPELIQRTVTLLLAGVPPDKMVAPVTVQP